MKKPAAAPNPIPAGNPRCLVQTVAKAFAREPALEAVKINHARHSISVATLGRPNNAEIEQAVTARIERIQRDTQGPQCGLLAGTSDCNTCATPLGPDVSRTITLQHDADTTTIARVTCPTAPKSWRWRDLPWPRLVPREVLLPDEEDHEHEWKLQLLAASLCGAFGLGGYFVCPPAPAIFLFVLAYLAGGWFTWHEVRERLRKGALDVHFLMLAVAIGSARIGACGRGAMLLFRVS